MSRPAGGIHSLVATITSSLPITDPFGYPGSSASVVTTHAELVDQHRVLAVAHGRREAGYWGDRAK